MSIHYLRLVRLMRLLSDRSGTFAVFFALALPILLGVTALCVDFTRALSARSHASNAADAATLAAVSKLATGEITVEKAKEIAETYFLAQLSQSPAINLEEMEGLTPTVEVDYEDAGGNRTAEVRLVSHGTVGMMFPVWFLDNPMLSYTASSVSTSSTQTHQALSMMLVLDQSGSMIECRFTVTRQIVENLFREYEIPDLQKYLAEVGFPYPEQELQYIKQNLASVDLSEIEGMALNLQHQPVCDAAGYTTRLTALQQAAGNFTQQLAQADPEMEFVRMGGVSYADQVKGFQPLTWGTQSTTGFVDAMRGGGGTDSSGAVSDAYDALMNSREEQEHLAKNNQEPVLIMVLMTDGANTSAEDDTYTLNRCQAARDNGVIVYTVAFEAPAAGQALLKACANNPANYFEADNADQLIAAFEQIGAEAANLLVRLAK